MAELPLGTVTFLFTDIEGSTRRWEQEPDAMGSELGRHDEILDDAIARFGGVVFSRMGDGVAAAFASPVAGLEAALAAQRALAAATWGSTGPLRVRMGLHTGEGVVVNGQYLSQPLNRCARLMAVGHGGQVLMSSATTELTSDRLPAGCELLPGMRDGVFVIELGAVADPNVAALVDVADAISFAKVAIKPLLSTSDSTNTPGPG